MTVKVTKLRSAFEAYELLWSDDETRDFRAMTDSQPPTGYMADQLKYVRRFVKGDLLIALTKPRNLIRW